MSTLIQTMDGWVRPSNLEAGCHLRVQHDVAIMGGRNNGTVLCYITDNVWYGTYTGWGYTETPPERYDIRLYEGGMWMYDGEKWFNIDDCKISVISLVVNTDELSNTDIPLCDFNNILE